MWSGPRNISTALMRSWGNRCDTSVCDEPLYAHFLAVTGKAHPGRHETLANHEVDWAKVVDWLIGPTPGDRPIFYQKHMAHHLLPDMDQGWIQQLKNCFLIRRPEEMLASLLNHVPDATTLDTGLPQQVALFDQLRIQSGRVPPVIDSRDVQDDPEGTLRALCESISIPFDPAMLSWPPGPRDTDGAWGPYWYSEVYKTTSFGKYFPKPITIPESHRTTLRDCAELYEHLYAFRCKRR
jgi:Sulfotransferase domain